MFVISPKEEVVALKYIRGWLILFLLLSACYPVGDAGTYLKPKKSRLEYVWLVPPSGRATYSIVDTKYECRCAWIEDKRYELKCMPINIIKTMYTDVKCENPVYVSTNLDKCGKVENEYGYLNFGFGPEFLYTKEQTGCTKTTHAFEYYMGYFPITDFVGIYNE